MSDLFRREAVAHATRRLSGDVMLVAPLSGKLLSVVFVTIVTAAAVIASVGSYARRESVSGWLTPQGGMIRVAALQSGVVEALYVSEGDVVAQAAPLAALKLSSDTAGGDVAQAMSAQMSVEGAAIAAQAAAAQGRLRTQKAEQEERRAGLVRALADNQHRVGLLDQRRKLAETAAARGEKLLQQGFLAKSNIEQLRTAALDAASDAAAARERSGDLERQIADLGHELAKLPADMAAQEAQTAQSRAALSQRRTTMESQSASVARAPIAGRVVALPLQQGQVARAGSTVAVLIPRGAQLTAELYVPSRAAGFVRQGQEVRLKYQAFPYQTFGTGRGVVTSISHTVLAPSEAAIPGLEFKEPVFRVRVALDRQTVSAYGQAAPLQPGMLLNAEVVIDRRSLLGWLLDPIYAVGRRS